MSSSLDDPTPLSSHGEARAPTVETIIASIPTLIEYIVKVKETIPEPEVQGTQSDNSYVGTGDTSVAGNNGEKSIGNDAVSVPCWSQRFGGDKKGVDNKQTTSSTDNNCANGNLSVVNGSNNGHSYGSSSPSYRWDNRSLHKQAEKLQRDLNHIWRSLLKFSSLEESFGSRFQNIEQHGHSLDQLVSSVAQVQRNTAVDASYAQQVHDKFRSIGQMIMHLKVQIPSLHKMSTHNTGADESDEGTMFDAYYLVGEEPKVDMKGKVQGAPAFKEFFNDFLCVFGELDQRSKLCLLCFSVFPENAVVKKRLLVNWWFGEGLVDHPVTDHITVDDILKNLIGKGFIEPVLKKLKVIGFRMDPLVRFVVISIAEKVGFFSFDSMGVPTEDFSWSYRACLVRAGGESSREKLITKANLDRELEKLRTIFNVNDPYPDFKLEWFSKLKNLYVLYLGSWEDSSKHHIEVEGTDFLKGLKHMKHLKFLSLRGISRITDLPDSICQMSNLRIFDLNSCHNLEVLPKNLDTLKQLIHLDISQCYLLDHIPKALALLTELQVLKGFVIGESTSIDSCTLNKLAGLRKLRKLSIYTARKDFPTLDEQNVLKRFEHLEKLMIVWGGRPSKAKHRMTARSEAISANPNDACHIQMGDKENTAKTQQDNISIQQAQPAQAARTTAAVGTRSKLRRTLAFKGSNPVRTTGDHRSLQKLELRCFPGREAPAWLIEGKLMPQKKLYITGGNLCSLGMINGKCPTWTVNILCLKFLSELKMDWRELQKSFPDLVCLEKVKCPKLTLFPCDEQGVWVKGALKAKQLEQLELGLSWSYLTRKPNYDCR